MAKSELLRTRQLIEAAVTILDEENPMTIRQLFYRLVSVGQIQNNRGDYQKVSRAMTTARDDGRIDWEWIVDRSRSEYVPNVFEDAAEYAEVVRTSYRKDYWSTQPNYCEIWVEKDAIKGTIEKLTNYLGVRVYPAKGYQSTTKAHEAAQRLVSIQKPITIFYLGDHDPSGRDIEPELESRIRIYQKAGAGSTLRLLLEYGPMRFKMKRLAIHVSDIQKFNLPPLRVKMTDSRAKGFLSEHGPACVELDALLPNELRRTIRAAVKALLDKDQWDRAVAVEKVELASIMDTVSRWPGQ